MSVKFSAIALFLLTACQTPPAQKLPVHEAVLLQVEGKSVALAELQAQLSEIKITVHEPHYEKNTELVGFSLIEILNRYAPAWQSQDGLLATALDGYKSDLSVAKILKYKPVLTYRFSRQAEFKVDNRLQNEKNVALGPYYLVWDNLQYPELKRQGGYDWPYQVASLQSIRYASHYAQAFPFKNPKAPVKAGFEYFKNYCMTCHSVSDNSEGGQKGPPLHPYPPLFQGGLKQFTQWTTQPSSLKPGTTMPALNPALTAAEKKEVVAKIYAYLSALHKK